MRNSLVCLLLLIYSCNQNSDNQKLGNIKNSKKQELVFANITKSWKFCGDSIRKSSGNIDEPWKEWFDFLEELSKKPANSILAYRYKTSELSKKVSVLKNTIPSAYNTIPIKTRLTVLFTKIEMLKMFLNLDDIYDKKIIQIFADINTNVVTLQEQIRKINQKNKIKPEEGESEMLNNLRAIPSPTMTSPI